MTAASTTETGTAAREEAEPFRLAVAGMSCASCVAHVEKSLNGIDGVRATVNLAPRQARAPRPPAAPPGPPGPARGAAGYGARPPTGEHAPHHDDEPLRVLMR